MSLINLDLSKKYSYADYLKWSFDERLELIKGKIHKMTPAPLRRHQLISIRLERAIDGYLKGQKCEMYHAPFDVRFPDMDGHTYTVVQPDICVVCDSEKLDEKGCVGAPDLIVEIVSVATSRKDYSEKYNLYEEQGVVEYWIVNPEGYLEMFHLVNGKYEHEGKFFKGDVVKSPTFPGLAVDLEEVFEGIE